MFDLTISSPINNHWKPQTLFSIFLFMWLRFTLLVFFIS